MEAKSTWALGLTPREKFRGIKGLAGQRWGCDNRQIDSVCTLYRLCSLLSEGKAVANKALSRRHGRSYLLRRVKKDHKTRIGKSEAPGNARTKLGREECVLRRAYSCKRSGQKGRDDSYLHQWGSGNLGRCHSASNRQSTNFIDPPGVQFPFDAYVVWTSRTFYSDNRLTTIVRYNFSSPPSNVPRN